MSQNHVIIADGVFTYLDILGTRGIHNSLEKSTADSQVSNWLKREAYMSPQTNEEAGKKCYFQSFSDSYFYVDYFDNMDNQQPLRDSMWISLFARAIVRNQMIQLKLLEAGYVVRGGISFGRVGIADRALYGIPIVNSVEVEERASKYACTTLSRAMAGKITQFRNNGDLHENDRTALQNLMYALVERLDDGYWSINPFRSNELSVKDFVDTLRIRELIVNNISKYEFDEKLREKYCFAALMLNISGAIDSCYSIPYQMLPKPVPISLIWNK